jgi:hypothetical protein
MLPILIRASRDAPDEEDIHSAAWAFAPENLIVAQAAGT